MERHCYKTDEVHYLKFGLIGEKKNNGVENKGTY